MRELHRCPRSQTAAPSVMTLFYRWCVYIPSAADYLEIGMIGTSVHLQPEQTDSREEGLEICLCMQAPKIITKTKKKNPKG